MVESHVDLLNSGALVGFAVFLFAGVFGSVTHSARLEPTVCQCTSNRIAALDVFGFNLNLHLALLFALCNMYSTAHSTRQVKSAVCCKFLLQLVAAEQCVNSIQVSKEIAHVGVEHVNAVDF